MNTLLVYTKNGCPNCAALLSNLRRSGVAYTELIVDQNQDAKDFLIAMGHRNVPVMYRGGVHLANFNDYKEVSI